MLLRGKHERGQGHEKDKMKGTMLKKGVLKIVGSTLHKMPRDLDIVLVISDRLFKKTFRLSAKDWHTEGKTGQWSQHRFVWSDGCISIGRVLQKRILKALSRYPLDFKIIPKSYDKK